MVALLCTSFARKIVQKKTLFALIIFSPGFKSMSTPETMWKRRSRSEDASNYFRAHYLGTQQNKTKHSPLDLCLKEDSGSEIT